MAEIDILEAGREMDALMAERVMGWVRYGDHWVTTGHEPNALGCTYRWAAMTFAPSTDIAAAWEVVEKLQDHGMAMSLVFGVYTWECKFGDAGDVFGEARHPDASLAICHAALEAMGANG